MHSSGDSFLQKEALIRVLWVLSKCVKWMREARKVCDNMVRLVRFTDGGEARVGVELSDGGDVADVTKVID